MKNILKQIVSHPIKTLRFVVFHPLQTLRFINGKYLHVGLRARDPELQNMKSWFYGSLMKENLESIFPGIEEISYKVIKGFKRQNNATVNINELNTLLAIQLFIKAENVLEIGTYDGGTALNMAANLTGNGKVYTVDLPSGFKDFALTISRFSNNAQEFKNIGIQYKGTEFENRIVQIYEDSAKIDYDKFGPLFDLVFIDGCHDYVYVKSDYEKVIKYVRKGGIIIWHDYGMIRDVAKFVDELSVNRVIHVVSGTRLALTII